MMALQEKRVARAVLGFSLPWSLGGALFGLMLSAAYGGGFGDLSAVATGVVLSSVAGLFVLIMSMSLRLVLRLNHRPDHFGLALGCGCVAIGCGLLCLYVELGGIAMFSAMCIAVMVFPFWNGKDAPSQQPQSG